MVRRTKSQVKKAVKASGLDSPQEYRQLLNRMFSDSTNLDGDYRDIQQMYNGESIFDEEKVKEFGIDLEGVNLLTMRSIMDNITLGYTGEFLSNTRLFRFASKFYTRLARNSDQVEEMDADPSVLSNQQVSTRDRQNSEGMDYALNKMLNGSRWWKKFLQKEVHETQLHGLSYAVWEDKLDPTPKLYPRYRVKVDAKTMCDVDSWNCFAIESIYTMQELYQAYLGAAAKKKSAKSTGWQEQGLAELLFYYSSYRKSNGNLTASDSAFSATAVDYVHRLRTGSESVYSNHSDSILLYNIYRKDIEGKITRVLIDKNLSTGDDFLLFNPKDRSSFSEIIFPFARKPWIDYLLEQVGIGHDVFAPDQVIEELTSYAINQTKIASGIIINAPEGERQGSEPIDIIPGVGINAGDNQISSSAVGTNLAAVTSFITFISNKLTSNLITSGYNMNVNDLEFNNDKQIEMFAFREARARKNIFDLYYQNLEGFMEVYLGKLLASKSHDNYETFIDYLEEEVESTDFLGGDKDSYGIPASLSFEVSKTNGTGSQFADQVMADKLLAVSGRLGPDEQDVLLKMYISANSTPEIADELTNKRLQDNNSKSEDQFSAVIAANQLEQGFQVPNSMDHDALIFSNVFIERINAIIESWQKGEYGETKVYATPEFQHLEGIPQETSSEQAFTALFALYSAASFHVSRLVNDPMNIQVGKRFKSILGELLNPLKQIEARAGQDAQARDGAIQDRMEKASDIQFDNELDRAKTMSKIQNEQAITQAKIQQREEMQSFNQILKAQKLQDDRQLDAAKLVSNRQIEALDVSQKNQFENIRRRQDLGNE